MVYIYRCVCVCGIWLKYFLLSHKKKEITLFLATWMNLELSYKESKPDRERQILYDITYMWNLK